MYTAFDENGNITYRTSDYDDMIDYARFNAYQGNYIEIIDEYGEEVEF